MMFQYSYLVNYYTSTTQLKPSLPAPAGGGPWMPIEHLQGFLPWIFCADKGQRPTQDIQVALWTIIDY